jgi:hypothetical protein
VTNLCTDQQNVWVLTDANINELQVDSIDRLIARCKAAHYVDICIRINGKDERVQADWLKHLKRVVEPTDQSQLMSFYDVRTKDELIDRLYHHIERLQAKLPPDGQRGVERVREG